MRPAIREPEIKPMDPATAERLDGIFAAIEPNKRKTPAESQELASDLWELARMRNHEN